MQMLLIKCILVLCAILPASANAYLKNIPPIYIEKAIKYEVPEQLLYSIALVESKKKYGDNVIPWPWTLNINEKAYRFKNRSEMNERLEKELANGNEYIAIGIMQIYWKYHKSSFDSYLEVTDPIVNLEYGAKLLRSLYEKHGDWATAIKRYHASEKNEASKQKAKIYLNSVGEMWKKYY